MTDVVPDAVETLAQVKVNVPVSIVVPTYREAENIPHLLDRIARMRDSHGLDCEVIFADDDSQDGSVEAVEASGYDWARILVRKTDHGLSPAVIDGFREACNPVLVCMDCDLSHPPERIPQMILGLAAGQQLVLGSRYVNGASTDDDWGFVRWLNSRVATLLARPLTSAKDPMSGFFVIRRSDFLVARDLNPVGYKIALELIVKCGINNVGEVPIHFTDRIYGESKLTLREQLKYLQHLRRLYIYRFANAMHLLQFLVVGASGVVVNLTVLTILQALGFLHTLSIAGGIAVSVVTNFFLNRRFTFSYARHGNIYKQFLGFVTASSIGIAVNYLVALYIAAQLDPQMSLRLQLAAICGIAAGMTFNFLGNRYVVFRKRFIQKH